MRAGWRLLAAAAAAGCAGNPSSPAATQGLATSIGSNYLETKAHYGVPILQKSLLWDGNGEVDNAGAGLRVFHVVADGHELGAGATLANWVLQGHHEQSAEIEGVLRLRPLDDMRWFWDFTGGYQHATGPVPDGGTEWNFSFGFGPGVALPLQPGLSVELAADYHHISNALGRQNPRNPSQNEARFWIGLAWNF